MSSSPQSEVWHGLPAYARARELTSLEAECRRAAGRQDHGETKRLKNAIYKAQEEADAEQRCYDHIEFGLWNLDRAAEAARMAGDHARESRCRSAASLVRGEEDSENVYGRCNSQQYSTMFSNGSEDNASWSADDWTHSPENYSSRQEWRSHCKQANAGGASEAHDGHYPVSVQDWDGARLQDHEPSKDEAWSWAAASWDGAGHAAQVGESETHAGDAAGGWQAPAISAQGGETIQVAGQQEAGVAWHKCGSWQEEQSTRSHQERGASPSLARSDGGDVQMRICMVCRVPDIVHASVSAADATSENLADARFHQLLKLIVEKIEAEELQLALPLPNGPGIDNPKEFILWMKTKAPSLRGASSLVQAERGGRINVTLADDENGKFFEQLLLCLRSAKEDAWSFRRRK
eukprot:TRINITY_DN34499_c0_g1_i1.p1 TRINITY_DN34499_c0_g1~~TRINITY_DN34499_c0_g1_i1.p1  ORF type:complete len:406 (+),score=87.40 TRINITY_DN34499_c0_g1_i1:58-1275(+)